MKALSACIVSLMISSAALAQATQVTAWLYRPAAASGLPLTLYMDGRKLAVLGGGEFFGIPVTPGLHSFNWTATPGAQQVVLPISADSYLEVHFGNSEPFLSITPLAADKAMAAMAGLRPVDRTTVADPGVIVPAQTIAATVPKASAPVQQHLTPAPPAPAQQPTQTGIEYGNPQELKSVTKIYVYTDLQLSVRQDIIKDLSKRLPQLQIMDRVEDAEVYLGFIADKASYLAGLSTSGSVATNGDISSTSRANYGTVNTGAGLVFKIVNGHNRLLMDFEDSQTVSPTVHGLILGALHGSPSGNFVKAFADAYVKANGKAK